MKVVVTGAAGNVGRSVVEALAERDEVSQIIGLAGATDPAWSPKKARWVSGDIASFGLEPTFRGADAVVHLAWAVQPTHDPGKLERLNVGGSRRVFEAVAAADVPKLIYSSSIVAYSPAPRDRLIDEDWPLGGAETSVHARYKARIEGHLDAFESVAPNTQVVRADLQGRRHGRALSTPGRALHPRFPAAQRARSGDPAAVRALLSGDPHLRPCPRLRPGHDPRRQRRLQPRCRAAAQHR
jgi:putative NADH-flavin reductase